MGVVNHTYFNNMAAGWRRNLFDLVLIDDDIPTVSTAEQVRELYFN